MRLSPKWKSALISTAFAAALLAASVGSSSARADDTFQTSTVGSGPIADEITPELRDRVRRGLHWLATNQGDDGSISSGGGDNVGITALAGIALLADGNLPNNGTYGKQIDKLLNYVLQNCQESGLIASNGYGSPMYGHGFATLFLAEIYGESPRDDVKEKLQAAVRVIVQSQNNEGGWRYQPVPADADTSVTCAQVMALRAARNAGIKVPKLTIDRAIDYVKRAQESDGGFSYMLNSRGSGFPRSAGCCALLYYAGVYSGKEINNGIKYISNFAPGSPAIATEYHYYYGYYYATQAMFMAGGDAWKNFWPAMKKDLIAKQQPDGSWAGEAGPAYASSMALIILQIPNRYLPILEK
jgi:hypothetical protein